MSINDDTHDVFAQRAPLPLIFAAAASLVCVVMLLKACAHGFDFTDESFYLVWIAHPFEYSLSVTQFGFIYHPLYVWLDGDIAALRRVNVLLTFALATALCFTFLGRHVIRAERARFSHLLLAVTLATTATTSLVFNGLWLATPGYNSLCLQSLLVASIGLLLAQQQRSVASCCGWLLLGLGGTLTFMAKPPSAAALAVCSLLYLVASGKWRTPLVALAIASAALGVIACAFAIDGSLSVFQARLFDGLDVARSLDSRYSVDRLLKLNTLHASQQEIMRLLAALAVMLGMARSLASSRPAVASSGAAVAMTLAVASGGVMLDWLPGLPVVGLRGGMLLFAAPLAALLLAAGWGRLRQLPRASWANVLCLLLLPYAYAFGTANNIWPHLEQAALFTILAGLGLLAALPERRQRVAALCALAIGIQLLAALQLSAGMRTPYRQPAPLAQQTEAVAIGPQGAMLRISKDFAAYLGAARSVLDDGRFAAGTPMIDLSGQSPGLLFAVGARNVGQAWSIGGLAGSATLAERMFRRAACADLARAWLVVEPASKRALPTAVLDSFGASLSRDFELVGGFDTAPGASGRRTVNQQQILKPLRSAQAATAACLTYRASSS